MRMLRTMGVIGTAVTILLAGTVVFAQGRATSTPGENRGSGYRASMASSTTARMQAAREAAQARMETRRENVAQRLLDIQDKVKQQMATRIAARFDTMNEKWTDHFMGVLDRLDALLDKVEARAGSGGSTASTTAAIQSATTAIETARTAVTAQAAKTYTLDASTLPTTATSTPTGQQRIMQGLRTSFQTLHSTFFKDLFALRDGVMKDARKAVQNAIQSLEPAPRANDNESNATSTSEGSDE